MLRIIKKLEREMSCLIDNAELSTHHVHDDNDPWANKAIYINYSSIQYQYIHKDIKEFQLDQY